MERKKDYVVLCTRICTNQVARIMLFVQEAQDIKNRRPEKDLI